MGLSHARRRPIDHGKESLVNKGLDKLWPEGYERGPVPKQFADGDNQCCLEVIEPEVIVTQQWGLKLPSGEVQWNQWQGISFHHPLDRLRMAATLQKTALDIGLSEGEQSLMFLAKYSWVTREQHATVVYEETGAHSLTAPEVSVMGAPNRVEIPHDDNRQQSVGDPAQSPATDIRERSVGGDAQ